MFFPRCDSEEENIFQNIPRKLKMKNCELYNNNSNTKQPQYISFYLKMFVSRSKMFILLVV